MARRRQSEEPRRSGRLVAWIALIVATVALAFALSDQPWLRQLIERCRENWSLAREELSQSRAQSEEEPDAAERLREASSAARLGEDRQVREHLAAAEEWLTRQSRSLSGALRTQCRELAREVASTADEPISGAQTARALIDLAERAEVITERAEREQTD